MDDIFYFIGFGYIIYLIHGIGSTIFDNGKEVKKMFREIKNSSPKDLTEVYMGGDSIQNQLSTTISPIISPLIRNAKKYRLGTMFYILFSLWIIVGAFRIEEDYTFFAFIIVQSLSYQLFIIIALMVNSFKRKDQSFLTSLYDEMEDAAKSKTTTIIHLILEGSKISVVSFILYNHFILQNT